MTEGQLLFAILSTVVIVALCSLVAVVIEEMGRIKGKRDE